MRYKWTPEIFICKISKNKIKCTENANDLYSYVNLLSLINFCIYEYLAISKNESEIGTKFFQWETE